MADTAVGSVELFSAVSPVEAQVAAAAVDPAVEEVVLPAEGLVAPAAAPLALALVLARGADEQVARAKGLTSVA